MKQFDVLGTPLQATTYDEFIAYCQQRVRQPGTCAVDLSNTQVVTMRRHEPNFRAVTECMDLYIPDGMPLIWALNRQGADLRDRVYGPTFMRRCIAASAVPYTHYFLGGSAECLQKLKENLVEVTPNLNIVGEQDGYFGPDLEDSIVAEINQLSPDFIWIGLGTPKQQAWICRNKPKITRGMIFAVGFAFDVNAGMKPDAPGWMQKRGLTWLFRLLSEPRRLGPRYLKYNLLFLFYLVRDSLLKRSGSVRPQTD